MKVNMVESAREFAAKAHSKQKYDGKPYVEAHLDKVVETARVYSRDPVVLAMAYLHDTLEDTTSSFEDIEAIFGKTVADGVFALTDYAGTSRYERQLKTYMELRKNTNATLVKICDRITNMSASFGTKHAFNYINEYERFVGSLKNDDHKHDQAWNDLESIYLALKQDIRDHQDIYLSFNKQLLEDEREAAYKEDD